MYITYCTVLYLKIMTYLRMITNLTYDNYIINIINELYYIINIVVYVLQTSYKVY